MDIEISINDKKFMTKSGITILEAAARNGIRIPVLCYLGRLKPIGSCRICVVEVKGIKNPLPSCVAKVKEGYEILTDTEKTWNVRKMVMSHLLLEHPLDCPVCDKSGECMLQDLSFEFGMTTQENERVCPDRTHIFQSDLIEYMATRCVLCSRCIRVCTDMYGNPFLQIKDKGFNGYIGLKGDDSLQTGSVPSKNCSFTEIKSDINYLDCYYCGNCVEVCPVGALVSKPSKFKERYWQESPFSSVCDKCSAACRMEYYRYDKDESLVRTVSLFGGYLCKAGFFYEGIGKDEGYYIQSPLVKKKSMFEETSKKEAVNEFASRIESISKKGGMENTAVLVSPGISTNDGFIISNFVRNILKPAYFDIAEPEFYRINLDKFKSIFKNEENFDIKTLLNSEVMLYIGSIEDEIPYVSYNIMKAHREHGGKLLLINIKKSAKTGFTRFEDIAYVRQDIELSSVHDFLNGLRLNLCDCDSEKGDEMVKSILKADVVSILIGDYPMSACNMDDNFVVIKEISDFLRNKEKISYIFPLIKSFNYRGLVNSGLNPSGNSGYDSIYSGFNAGKIKNLIYIGDPVNDYVTKELIKYAADLEYLAVFSSKTGILSAMADVVIPIKDFLEGRDSFYENFEGKTINLNNDFNLGQYRYDIMDILTEISDRLGRPFNHIEDELLNFTNSLKTGDVVHYNKIKHRSRFYYDTKSNMLY
ncbi:MAG TPA: 2Fe-2S iron-sulfur cluster binding domain-containing protein [bacterium]|nr:2Fe-2S iron-sulfur cluster binding domain-containing protein [bacterium]